MQEHDHIHDHGHDHFVADADTGIFELLLGVFEEALMITFFVMIMMLLIEYITVQTRGQWSLKMERSPWMQILFAAVLGLIPGCLGTFTAVSLYVHHVFNFTALVTVMIASAGDEAFVMLSMNPRQGIMIILMLFGIALVSGLILHFIFKNKNFIPRKHHHHGGHHHEVECVCYVPKQIMPQLRNISFERAMILTGLFIFLVFLLGGVIGPNSWDWRRVTYLVVSLIGVFIIGTVPDQFLKEHLWQHTIKIHVGRIFLWTFAAFFVIQIILPYLNLDHWLEGSLWIILVVAVLVGIIPQSGPNIIFISLFFTGAIPLSILLANSVVQDGHGALPLLGESRKSFIYMKAVNVIVGLIVGAIGLSLGF